MEVKHIINTEPGIALQAIQLTKTIENGLPFLYVHVCN